MMNRLVDELAFFKTTRLDKFIKSFNFNKTLADIEQILISNSEIENADIWYLKGALLLHKHDINEALVCLNKAISIDPTDKLYRYKKSIALQKQGDYIKAIECCNEIINIDKNYTLAIKKKIELLKIYIHFLYQNKDFGELVVYCDQLLEMQPNNKHILIQKSQLLIKANDYHLAMIYVDKAISFDAQFSPAWYIKGLLLALNDQYEAALSCCNKVQISKINNTKILLFKSCILFNMMLFFEALNCCNEIINKDGCFSELVELKSSILEKLGTIAEKKKNFHDSRLYYDQLLVLNPKNIYIFFKVIVVLMKQEEYETALDYVEKIIECSEKNNDAYLAKIIIYLILKKFSEALIYIDLIKKFDFIDSSEIQNLENSIKYLQNMNDKIFSLFIISLKENLHKQLNKNENLHKDANFLEKNIESLLIYF